MPVPTHVKTVLDTQKIAYAIATTPIASMSGPQMYDQHLRQLGAAKSVILQDDQGRMQVLFPANCLLDLNTLNRSLGRKLRAIPPNELKQLFDKHQFQSLPALPKIAGFPTAVDRRLLDSEAIFLDSGGPGELLELKRGDFEQILSESTLGDYSIPLETLEPDPPVEEDGERIFNAVKNFTSLRIKQRLEETLELPPLPNTAQQIIKLRVDPNADVNDLAAIVEMDPSLAAQVVSWAASPYYSAPGKIKSVHDAIVRVLGFDMVLNLSLGLALGRSLSMPKDGPRGIEPYWQNAVYTAATVEGLVTAIPRQYRPGFGMAYLSGLLHNFGFLVLAEVFPPHFATICRYQEANPHVDHQLIERHILGITRDQICAWQLQLWNMPEEVVTAVRHQTNPQFAGDNSVYANLVYLARRLLRLRGIGTGPREQVPHSLIDKLQLPPDKMEATMDHIMESSDELKNIARQLGTA